MGRMGNQMFQYACAKMLQWEYGFTTSLSDLDKLSYFELEAGERPLNRLKSFLFFRLYKPVYGMNTINTRFDCLYRSYLPELISVQKPTMVWGFFQSPIYFENVALRLSKTFSVKTQYRTRFKQFLLENNLVEGNYLVIHVRRTDYKGFTLPGLEGDDFTLPNHYYSSALKQCGWDGAVVFVSDDPAAIPVLFPDIKSAVISKEDGITDFLIIQNASVCILSNSTFAWWAAWLNGKASAIYCPQYFLGFKENKEVPVGIYPEHWKEVNVYAN
jgi:hypothetical protein